LAPSIIKPLVSAPVGGYLMDEDGMAFDDERRVTLDPGLTVLALRARHTTPGRYPFLEPALRAHRWSVLATRLLATGLAAWRRRRVPRGAGAPEETSPPRP
jgi:hypothetical protein